MFKRMIGMLPDKLAKQPDSIIGRILLVYGRQYNEVVSTLETMCEWVDIDRAQGKELDEIGADIRQPRGLANDAQYRMMIRSKRLRAQSDGTYNAIIDSMSRTLGCKPEDFRILSDIEAGGNEPLALVIERLPLIIMNNAGLTQSQLVALVEQVTPGDVRVVSANFEGTFEFGAIDMESDPERGFSDQSGEIGGYFGALYVPDGDQRLPI